MSEVTVATAGDFAGLVATAAVPVLVDFWAPWCGPCLALAPTLHAIAQLHAGKIVVAKLNVDDCPDVAARFSVLSIPTLLVFVDGAPCRRLVGARSKTQLLADLAEFVV